MTMKNVDGIDEATIDVAFNLADRAYDLLRDGQHAEAIATALTSISCSLALIATGWNVE